MIMVKSPLQMEPKPIKLLNQEQVLASRFSRWIVNILPKLTITQTPTDQISHILIPALRKWAETTMNGLNAINSKKGSYSI